MIGGKSYLDVFREKSVEEVDICGLEVDEVLELLNWRRLHCQKSEACVGCEHVEHQSESWRGVTYIAAPEPRSSRHWGESGRRDQGTCGQQASLTGCSRRWLW
jgi:hypothetical protein